MLSGQESIPECEKLIRVFSVNSRDSESDHQGGLRSIVGVADRHNCLLKVLRIVARVIAGSKDRAAIMKDPTAEGILRARLLLEIVFGQETKLAVREGKLVGLDPQMSRGRYVTRGGFGRGITVILGIVELPILLLGS